MPDKKATAKATAALCIYHEIDMDGCCSAALVNKFAKATGLHIDFLGYNYEGLKAEEILSRYPDSEIVFIVDTSIPPEEVEKLMDANCVVIWCDHHVSAIRRAQEAGLVSAFEQSDCVGGVYHEWSIRTNGSLEVFLSNNELCGAELVCKMLDDKLGQARVSLKIVELTQLIGVWDTWKTEHSRRADAERLNAYLSSYDIRLPNGLFIWENLFSGELSIESAIGIGEVCLRTLTRQNEKSAARAFDLEWEGLTFCAVNAAGNSKVVDSVFSPDRHDAVLLFFYSGKTRRWVVRMYANDNASIDLSQIAIKYGGGGHRGACGFESVELPFDISK